jgi:hypothetical protein
MSVPVLSRWHWCGFYNTDELGFPPQLALPCHCRTLFSNFTNMQVNIHLQFILHEAVSVLPVVDKVAVQHSPFLHSLTNVFIIGKDLFCHI